jgi:hypothetical protein
MKHAAAALSKVGHRQLLTASADKEHLLAQLITLVGNLVRDRKALQISTRVEVDLAQLRDKLQREPKREADIKTIVQNAREFVQLLLFMPDHRQRSLSSQRNALANAFSKLAQLQMPIVGAEQPEVVARTHAAFAPRRATF